jgi:uncharacterized protein YyaL (SSP411 family)
MLFMNHHKHTNTLIKENSPYLLQHAHNPVNWYPWNDETLELAKAENKLLIISIGYAACHWCHVMEEESFEDESVAEIMNAGYINIKVDREERPDVDQAYMNAIQLMTGRGGWPMNVVTLPDGRPVWGGTYFRKDQWKSSLGQLADLYEKDPEKMHDYATKLEEGLKQMQLIPESGASKEFSKEDFNPILKKWEQSFDIEYGGSRHAPKFIIPSNFQFLLRYSEQNKDSELKKHVLLSLDKISYGGIYDPIDGGFSRYSVDVRWHVPHFEKMLYDNAQLVSLYSQAYSDTKNNWYREVVKQSLQFIKENLSDPTGAFYSSLDADSLNSEGKLEEGVFYSWEKSELKKLLKDDFELFSDYYNINSFGKWEDEKYVLIRTQSDSEISQKHQIPEEKLLQKKKNWREILKEYRNKRDKPRLDDKQITSWNALMLTGYLDAFKAFNISEYLETALKNANFILKNILQPDGSLHHTFKNGESRINGYLEDYAFVIAAFLNLYQVTLDKKWLETSKKLADYSIDHFYDNKVELFYFTSNKDRPLITRNIDTTDNVIPSSNSVMAKNLFILSKYFENGDLLKMSKNMLSKISGQIKEYPQGHSNWLDLKLNFTNAFYEIVVTGENAVDIINELNSSYLPNIIIDGTVKENNSRHLTKSRFKSGEDLIYVCTDGTCQLPVRSIRECIKLIKYI